MTGFTKLFSTIVHSTVWREKQHVKIVWITMLALADRQGRVSASMPGLADAARVSIPECVEALARLASPDEHSRTKAHEGRRIAEIDGGWQLLNYLKYRETRDEAVRRLQVRDAVARHRAKASKPSNHVSQSKPRKAQAEAEAETEERQRTAPAVADAESVAIVPSNPFPPKLVADVYLRHYPKAEVPKPMFAVLKRLCEKHGWQTVEAQLEAYLVGTEVSYHNWAKFASGFGSWGGLGSSQGDRNVLAAMKFIERGK